MMVSLVVWVYALSCVALAFGEDNNGAPDLADKAVPSAKSGSGLIFSSPVASSFSYSSPQWAQWGAWTQCISVRNGVERSRTRQCLGSNNSGYPRYITRKQFSTTKILEQYLLYNALRNSLQNNRQRQYPQYNTGGQYPQYYNQGQYPQYYNQGQYPQYYNQGQYPQYYNNGQYPQYNGGQTTLQVTCPGLAYQVQSCSSSYDGLSWGAWSRCSNGLQTRQRRCYGSGCHGGTESQIHVCPYKG